MRRIEALEQRQLMAWDTVTLEPVLFGNSRPVVTLTSKGTLAIDGTSSPDFIEIRETGSQYVVTTALDDAKGSAITQKFSKSAVKRVMVNAAGGGDHVTIGASVTRPTTVLGGAGSDSIDAFNLNVTIAGGDGRDQIRHSYQPTLTRLASTTIWSVEDGFRFVSDSSGRILRVISGQSVWLGQTVTVGPRGPEASSGPFTITIANGTTSATFGQYTNAFGTAFSSAVIDGGAGNDSITTNCVGEEISGGGGVDAVFYNGSNAVTFDTTAKPTGSTPVMRVTATIWIRDMERTASQPSSAAGITFIAGNTLG
ncbi:MAG: hypothetical protein QM770_16260 [Tepidisphaeraceae bacterium]